MKDYIPSKRYYNSIGITDDVLQKYFESLILHITYVQEAGKKLGISNKQLDKHDNSKWRKIQFGGYAKHFFGGGAGDRFALAWLDHIHRENHHWEHWLFSNGYSPKGSHVERGAIQMPKHYALEMIADWQGASRIYVGTYEMSSWLEKNISKISLHSKTALFVEEQLNKLGYKNITSNYHFNNGVKND